FGGGRKGERFERIRPFLQPLPELGGRQRQPHLLQILARVIPRLLRLRPGKLQKLRDRHLEARLVARPEKDHVLLPREGRPGVRDEPPAFARIILAEMPDRKAARPEGSGQGASAREREEDQIPADARELEGKPFALRLRRLAVPEELLGLLQ